VAELAIIGGTGLTSLNNLEITHREVVQTPYGEPSGPLTEGEFLGRKVIFLPRHGSDHTIPPHKINYRANIWALKNVGVKCVIAVAAVGGINADMTSGKLVIPDQIIDYTWSRGNTYFEDSLNEVVHIDFTYPYDTGMREKLVQAAQAIPLDIIDGGTYGATQGPRLETIAEIDRLERDGCDIVGMTGMPEAALARELDLCYATCAVVANMAAGRGDGLISMEEINNTLRAGMDDVKALLSQVVPLI
jgi:5'-deoxy-5'-methylthioadenosine phosphorylase